MAQTKEKKTIIKRIVLIFAVFAVLLYFGGVAYFNTHFYPFTKINNIDCGFLSVEAAIRKIVDATENYTYTIKSTEKSEQIKGSDIDLLCNKISGVDKLKEKQNPFAWVFDASNRALKADIEISYNEDKLFNAMEWLECVVDTREALASVPKGFVYNAGSYSLGELAQKKIFDFGRLFYLARLDVYELKEGISLEKEGLYVPLDKYPQVEDALTRMNQLVSSSITYLRGEQSFVVNGDAIHEWVSVGDDFAVYLDTPQIKEYVRILSTFYDTVGTKRNFVTSKGETIQIGGGNYGWKVNQAAEAAALESAILNGETIVKEPSYARIAAVHGDGCDIYNTYVEISLASQRLWFYKDGVLVVETPVVTGNPFLRNATPPGVFGITYKTKDAILRGADYETPVKFWMPFNGGIGLHDATWRGAFGGSIYRGNGSHGCVNMPYGAAQKVFEKISRNDPVVVY